MLSWWDLRCENRQVIFGDSLWIFPHYDFQSCWFWGGMWKAWQNWGGFPSSQPSCNHPLCLAAHLQGRDVGHSRKKKNALLIPQSWLEKRQDDLLWLKTLPFLISKLYLLSSSVFKIYSGCPCPGSLCKLLVLQESVESGHRLDWAQGRVRLCKTAHPPLPQCLFYSNSMEWKRFGRSISISVLNGCFGFL